MLHLFSIVLLAWNTVCMCVENATHTDDSKYVGPTCHLRMAYLTQLGVNTYLYSVLVGAISVHSINEMDDISGSDIPPKPLLMNIKKSQP